MTNDKKNLTWPREIEGAELEVARQYCRGAGKILGKLAPAGRQAEDCNWLGGASFRAENAFERINDRMNEAGWVNWMTLERDELTGIADDLDEIWRLVAQSKVGRTARAWPDRSNAQALYTITQNIKHSAKRIRQAAEKS